MATTQTRLTSAMVTCRAPAAGSRAGKASSQKSSGPGWWVSSPATAVYPEDHGPSSGGAELRTSKALVAMSASSASGTQPAATTSIVETRIGSAASRPNATTSP